MERFKELNEKELMGMDGGVGKFVAEVGKDLVKWIIVDTIYENAIKPAIQTNMDRIRNYDGPHYSELYMK